MMVRRPDQRLIRTAPGTIPGSRSASAETAATLRETGIPPLVAGLQSAVVLNRGPGLTPFLTLPQAGRIWGVLLSGIFATGATYSAGIVNVTYDIENSGGTQLFSVLQLAANGPSQLMNGQAPPIIFGQNFGPDTLYLNVNSGATVTNATLRASALAFYTVP